jgi:hypothetical protein
LFAIGAETIKSMVIPAVNFDHLKDGLRFSVEALVHELCSVTLKMLGIDERKSLKIPA